MTTVRDVFRELGAGKTDEESKLYVQMMKYKAALIEIEEKGHAAYHGRGYSLADIAQKALKGGEL